MNVCQLDAWLQALRHENGAAEERAQRGFAQSVDAFNTTYVEKANVGAKAGIAEEAWQPSEVLHPSILSGTSRWLSAIGFRSGSEALY